MEDSVRERASTGPGIKRAETLKKRLSREITTSSPSGVSRVSVFLSARDSSVAVPLDRATQYTCVILLIILSMEIPIPDEIKIREFQFLTQSRARSCPTNSRARAARRYAITGTGGGRRDGFPIIRPADRNSVRAHARAHSGFIRLYALHASENKSVNLHGRRSLVLSLSLMLARSRDLAPARLISPARAREVSLNCADIRFAVDFERYFIRRR